MTRRCPTLASLLGLALALGVAAGSAGCSCEEPTDEERLREQLDVTKVHLYVAAKMALGTAGEDGRVAVARTQLLTAYRAASQVAHGDDPAGLLSVVEGTEGLSLDGTAVDVVELARALFELRAMGRDEVRRWGDEEAPLILPVLFEASGAEGTAELTHVLDRDTEHALILLVLFMAKFHPRNPIPVPVELLLYEGYVIDAQNMSVPGLAPLVYGIRSYFYATSTYCDLAAEEGVRLDEIADEESLASMGQAIETIGVETNADREAGLGATLAALAHGSTALCFMERDDWEAADDELTAFCDRAEEAGAPAEELALLRVYLAIQNDDYPEARVQLALARTRAGITPEETADLDELDQYLSDEDRGLLGDYFDRAFFASWTMHYALARLESSGFLEGLEDTPSYHALMAFLVAMASTLQTAQRSVPSFSEATDQGRGWWDSLWQ